MFCPPLEKVEGPECPKCGCQASGVIALYRHWNVPHERRRCDHCAAIFSVPADPSVSGPLDTEPDPG